MIKENDNSRFQFSADDDEPEAIVQDELRELKIEKLGQRVTLLTILIPCMIGVILVITYLDIKDRVTRSYDTGAIGVQKLSKDLASKFSSLSLDQAKIKDIQAKTIPELEKSAAFLKSRITKLQKSMTQVTDSTISRDELTRVAENLSNKIADLTKKIADIPHDLKPDFEALTLVNDQIIEDAGKMSHDLKMLSDSMTDIDSRLDTIRKGIETVSENAIDKGDLELALKLKEIGYRQSLLDKTALLEKEIQALRKEFKDLKKGNISSSNATPVTQPPLPISQKPASGNESTKPAGDKPSTVESGGLVEQTIE